LPLVALFTARPALDSEPRLAAYTAMGLSSLLIVRFW